MISQKNSKTMSENRETSSAIINISLLIIILISCTYQMYGKSFYRSLKDTYSLIILCSTFLIACVILLRVHLFIEELFYIKENYKGDFLSVTKAAFNFNLQSWIMIAIILVSYLMILVNLNFSMMQLIQLNLTATLFAFTFSLLLFHSVDIMDCRIRTVATIFSTGLNPGSAMAGSYFYGYLKIMLPASGGTERAGMLTALETYENNEKVPIPVKKLFILIPSSSYIPPDLREISDNWLESAKSLTTVAIDRAGVKNRTYHNTVYRLRTKGPNQLGKDIYLATEGATPLKTFLEVQDKSHRYSSLYKEYNPEIIKNFYITLQNHLNDNPDCRDYCELVYYEDFVDGERVNPAHVLMNRLSQYIKIE